MVRMQFLDLGLHASRAPAWSGCKTIKVKAAAVLPVVIKFLSAFRRLVVFDVDVDVLMLVPLFENARELTCSNLWSIIVAKHTTNDCRRVFIVFILFIALMDSIQPGTACLCNKLVHLLLYH